jgi:hypothetical protein
MFSDWICPKWVAYASLTGWQTTSHRVGNDVVLMPVVVVAVVVFAADAAVETVVVLVIVEMVALVCLFVGAASRAVTAAPIISPTTNAPNTCIVENPLLEFNDVVPLVM